VHDTLNTSNANNFCECDEFGDSSTLRNMFATDISTSDFN